MKRYIKPTTEQRNEVNEMVLDIQKLLEGKEWGPSLAALTICIGEMADDHEAAQQNPRPTKIKNLDHLSFLRLLSTFLPNKNTSIKNPRPASPPAVALSIPDFFVTGAVLASSPLVKRASMVNSWLRS